MQSISMYARKKKETPKVIVTADGDSTTAELCGRGARWQRAFNNFIAKHASNTAPDKIYAFIWIVIAVASAV